MGRAKLEIKYREKSRARVATYMTRMKGLKKKAGELSLLCGVDVLVASFSPELNTVQFWPEQNTLEFRRIKERYLHFRRSEKNTGVDCSTTVERNNGNNENIPSFPLFMEELAAMDLKLKEVRERLCFIQASSSSSSSSDGDAANKEQPLQVTAPPSLPLMDQPYAFGRQPLPALADHFTTDDWNWCDSLVDYDD